MEVMALAGFLHDIGKTQIPRDVLYKQGPLSKSEWTLMRQHVLLGHNLLRQIRKPSSARSGSDSESSRTH